MRELMWKYRDLPMDLAGAALVRVADRERAGGCSRSTSEILKFAGCIGWAASKSCLDQPAAVGLRRPSLLVRFNE
jgi:hypothetical protein